MEFVSEPITPTPASNFSYSSTEVAQQLSSTGPIYTLLGADSTGNIWNTAIQTDKDNVKVNGDLEVLGLFQPKPVYLQLYGTTSVYEVAGSAPPFTYTFTQQPFNSSGKNGYYYLTFDKNVNTNCEPILENKVQYKVPYKGVYSIQFCAVLNQGAEIFISKNKGGHNSSGYSDLNATDGTGPLAYAGSNSTLSAVVPMKTTDYLCFGFYTTSQSQSVNPRTSVIISLLYSTI